ncbi:DUF3397 domain-containing protein [Calidifontibacillus erzurumensis]|uniref:DUF3397 domain-containing protein n=1 Tax=Calidifontibacillus erzurumensis TaxID=2741433 RepID=A0A8J8KAG1_9BACI|nr:DUF3397 domain-containing protein [Calidifontibacillus erzurumensis]NSL50769.1 DUF3397 domain-containing protein [Calidifontibacillus erzurumensis]
MVDFIAAMIATIITIPIFAILIVYWVTRWITHSKKKSFHLSVDISTLFFITAVHYLIIAIWGQSFLWIILLLLIVIASVFVFLQWKMNNEIIFKKVWKGFWRFNFLVFSFGYFTLIIYGLFKRLTDL